MVKNENNTPDNLAKRWQSALHESGHAVAAAVFWRIGGRLFTPEKHIDGPDPSFVQIRIAKCRSGSMTGWVKPDRPQRTHLRFQPHVSRFYETHA